MSGSGLGLKLFVGVVIAVVVASVAVGIFLAGTPNQRRAERLDDIRVANLQSIHRAVTRYWETQGQLPPNLAALQSPDYYVDAITDPVSDVTYEYRVTGQAQYELCATFDTDSVERNDTDRPFSEQFWDHGQGRQCFTLEANDSEPGASNGVPKPTPPAPVR